MNSESDDVIKLHRVLQKWLDTTPGEQHTWNVLIEAIRKPYVSTAKAEEIEQTMGF